MRICTTSNQFDFETHVSKYKNDGWDIQLDENAQDSFFASRSISRLSQFASIIKLSFLCLMTLFLYKPVRIELKYAWNRKQVVQLKCTGLKDAISKIFDRIMRSSPINKSPSPVIQTIPTNNGISRDKEINPKKRPQENSSQEKSSQASAPLASNVTSQAREKQEHVKSISDEKVLQTAKKEEVLSDEECEHGTKINEFGEYEGFFKKGLLHGKGKISFKCGHIYEGRFENGQLINGKKIYKLDEGYEIHEGEFYPSWKKVRQYHPEVKLYQMLYSSFKGTKIDKDGTLYEGLFCVNSCLQGMGKKTTKDNVVYTGEFSMGKLNGKGQILDKNGIVIQEGIFKNDLLQGKGKKIDKDGTISVGMFENGYLSGKGIKTQPDGTIFEGLFKYHQLNGPGGRITYKKWGQVWEGEFYNDWLNGPGKITYDSGKVLKGIFKNNHLIKEE